ncbi:MAG: hypothetical protein AB8W37_07780 [Arsenophonus endosymbiont of Dermacentor nuttalli]
MTHWQYVQFKVCHQGVNYQFIIIQEKLSIICDQNTEIQVAEREYRISAGKIININYKNEVVALKKGIIFDLDGVIVDTAFYHFKA